MSHIIQVVQPSGSISATNAKQLQDELAQALTAPSAQTVLVNLAAVELLDSAGLVALVSAYRLAQSLEKRLTLCAVPPAVQIVLELTQLDRVFDIQPEVAPLELAA